MYYVSSGLTLLVEMSNHLQQKESKRKGNGPLLPAKRTTAFRDGSLEKMIERVQLLDETADMEMIMTMVFDETNQAG